MAAVLRSLVLDLVVLVYMINYTTVIFCICILYLILYMNNCSRLNLNNNIGSNIMPSSNIYYIKLGKFRVFIVFLPVLDTRSFKPLN